MSSVLSRMHFEDVTSPHVVPEAVHSVSTHVVVHSAMFFEPAQPSNATWSPGFAAAQAARHFVSPSPLRHDASL